MPRQCDFSGYATKTNVPCSDGRVIRKDAFKHNNGQTVPLVWQHQHNDPDNILGHATLEHREDGVYAYCTFNQTPKGQLAKSLVGHGDIRYMSILANQLKQRVTEVVHGMIEVVHGMIREVSLVLTGANPEATIDNLYFAHSEEMDETSAVITFGTEFDGFTHADDEGGSGSDRTLEEIFNTLTEEQKEMVYAMFAMAGGDGQMAQSGLGDDDFYDNEGGTIMHFNAFADSANSQTELRHSEQRAQMRSAIPQILEDAKECGSLRTAFLAHAQEYGIENIEILFPEAQTLGREPDLISRQMDWVPRVLNAIHKSPFSRIKSTAADITADEARARGYVTGSRKKEEVIKLLKRVTGPTTVYKKQKLDRDDVVDITDFDIIVWIRAEMRVMLDEELARAALIGDGREVEDEGKINEESIRPIWTDDEMYATHITLDATATPGDQVDAFVRARKQYKGSGSPILLTTNDFLVDILLSKDSLGRRYYNTTAEVASALNVTDIVEVEVMENQKRTNAAGEEVQLLGIVVNLKDYTMGADKGGQVATFDDFDIDYNQYKYLIETRCSGALTKPKSALVFEKKTTAG